jgi:hypothetical protein
MLTKLKINRILYFIVLLFLVISCAQKEEKNYVAKVGDSFLTEEMIEASNNSSRFREEFIRNWIESELIYLDAQKKGVLTTDEFEKIYKEAKVEIAKSLVIKNMIADSVVSVSDEILEEFYVHNSREFQISAPKVIYNQAIFKSKTDALKFRKMVLHDGWNKTVNFYSQKGIAFSLKMNKKDFVVGIANEKVRDYFSSENPKKYSAVLELSKNVYCVLDLVKKYMKHDLPEFEEIKDEIEDKYISIRRNAVYNNYLKKLFSEHSSEIER